MMLAIYKGGVYVVGDNLNECELLDRESGARVQLVDYGDPDLLVDPTDSQVEAAEQGKPLPPETCAICHKHPHHDSEWNYRTRDGYGVCDACGQSRRHLITAQRCALCGAFYPRFQTDDVTEKVKCRRCGTEWFRG
jgi:hypothetical protein